MGSFLCCVWTLGSVNKFSDPCALWSDEKQLHEHLCGPLDASGCGVAQPCCLHGS